NQGDRSLFLDIWTIEKARRIARVRLISVPYSLLAGVPQPEARVGDRFIRYAANGHLIVLFDGEDLRVLQWYPEAASTNAEEKVFAQLKEISRIPLDLGSPQNNALVQSMEVARDGSRVALEICNPRQGSFQTVRVYDLASRSVLR